MPINPIDQNFPDATISAPGGLFFPRRWCLAALLFCGLSTAATAQDKPLRAMYFGNSFLENSVPWFHPAMFATADKDLELTTRIGPGWQVWMHVDTFHTQPKNTKDVLATGDWNAVAIQHYGPHPLLKDNVRDHVWHNQTPWPEPRDVSDFASTSFIIDELLKARPDDGRVFIYVSWPGIPGASDFQKRVKDETQKSLESQGLEREAVLKEVKERKATLAEMAPLMESFDYRAEWLAPYERNDAVPSSSKHDHSRDYSWQLMELLKEKYPKLWQEGRLAQIPNGDVFLALDEKMRAGQVPGITNIGFFSRDGGHIRAGLPRYTVAATVYAVMFGEHPGDLDASLYNDLDNYANEKFNYKMPGVVGSGYVHGPDLGELLEITPERKKIVDDTIWEVVSTHPHTNIRK